MSRQLARASLEVALLALVFAAGETARADQESYSAPAELATASGAEIYSHVCQGCHMPEAQGATGAGRYPKLAGDPQLGSWEFAALTVVRGRAGMPAFGRRGSEPLAFLSARLDDAQIARVINYVRSHFGNRYQETVTAADIAKIPHPGAPADR